MAEGAPSQVSDREQSSQDLAQVQDKLDALKDCCVAIKTDEHLGSIPANKQPEEQLNNKDIHKQFEEFNNDESDSE